MAARLSALALLPLVASLLLAAPAPAALNPQLTITYDAGKLTFTLGDGTPVGTGTVLTPGVYDIVFDVKSGGPVLLLTGPGLTISWNEPAEAVFTRMLVPDATYTLSDDDPGSAAIVFRTGDPVPGTTTTPTAPSTGPAETNTSVVGSSRTTPAPTVKVTLAASGTPSLTSGGKPVTRLRRGSYRLSLVDRNARAGIALDKAGGPARSLTGGAFVGARTITVELTPGRWTVSAGRAKRRTFLVTAP